MSFIYSVVTLFSERSRIISVDSFEHWNDVIVAKKHFFICVEKYARLKWKKGKLTYHNYHYWICLNMPEYA